MNFEPVKALEIFNAVLRGQGLDPAAASLTNAHKERVADLVNEALREAWRFAMWPGLMDVKRILYREEWAAGTAYEADAEVAHRGADGVPVYWRAARASTGVTPGTDATAWEVPEDFVPGFYFCRHFIDEIDLEAGVFGSHPDLRRDPKAYSCVKTHYGACVQDASGTYPAEPWVRFRPMPPKYSWTAYAAGTAYVAGDVAYNGGSSWLALVDTTGTTPGTDSAVWAETPFPEMFRPYVVAHAAAMLMQDDDGRAAQMARAARILDDLEDRQVGQTRSRRRARVRVC